MFEVLQLLLDAEFLYATFQHLDWSDWLLGFLSAVLAVGAVAGLVYLVALFFDYLLAGEKVTGVAKICQKYWHKAYSTTTTYPYKIGDVTFYNSTTTHHPPEYILECEIEDQIVKEYFTKSFWDQIHVGDELEVEYSIGGVLGRIYTGNHWTKLQIAV